jgi:tRNA threonylcarbamoyladenosine biosynthesis protein TsaB
MTILTLEFSSPQRSVAVARDGNVLSEAVETGGRNTAAFGMIEKVLAEAKIRREQIGALCIGLGPGSYTGIRSAIAIAQGWQLAREIKLLGIGSVEAIAAQAQAEKFFGRVNVLIDAQRGEFYVAAFEISADDWREIESLKILSLTEVRSRADANEILTGPEVAKCFPNSRTIFPRAAVLGRLAATRSDFIAGEKMEPIYLRETNFVKLAQQKNGFASGTG